MYTIRGRGRIGKRTLEPAWVFGAQALPVVGRKAHVLERRRASNRIRGAKEKWPEIHGFVAFAVSAEGAPDEAALREIASSHVGFDHPLLEFFDREPVNARTWSLVETQDDTLGVVLGRRGTIDDMYGFVAKQRGDIDEWCSGVGRRAGAEVSVD